MAKISVVVPCYNEAAVLPLYFDAVSKVADEMTATMEWIFVNDGSKDDTLRVIKELAKKDPRVRYVSFSRNFGKEAAMLAGLSYAKGEYVAVMDADLQDPPELLLQMYEILQKEGVDCVASRRVSRKGEPPIRSWFARRFYRLINRLSATEIVDGARDFRMMTRQMVDSILSLGEVNRFSKGIFGWVGFETKWLEYENRARAAGETKWSFWKLFLYSIDGIVAFSTKPLSIAAMLGGMCCVLSFLGIIFTVVRQILFHSSAFGWSSLICVILLLAGIQLFCLGILGQYLAKTYLEVKKRPIYIVKETDKENEI